MQLVFLTLKDNKVIFSLVNSILSLAHYNCQHYSFNAVVTIDMRLLFKPNIFLQFVYSVDIIWIASSNWRNCFENKLKHITHKIQPICMYFSWIKHFNRKFAESLAYSFRLISVIQHQNGFLSHCSHLSMPFIVDMYLSCFGYITFELTK